MALADTMRYYWENARLWIAIAMVVTASVLYLTGGNVINSQDYYDDDFNDGNHSCATYIPWGHRMEMVVDEYAQTKNSSNVLFRVSDVEAIERDARIHFNITRRILIVLQCGYGSDDVINGKCDSSLCSMKSESFTNNRFSSGDVLLRFGNGACAKEGWPGKSRSSQRFVSELGEARTTNGLSYYKFRRHLSRESDDDIVVSFDPREDVTYSSSNENALPASARRPVSASVMASYWFDGYNNVTSNLASRSAPV
jgi:hypothetical protein